MSLVNGILPERVLGTTVILGAMRIKNESRWIARVIEAQLPVVQNLFIFDDHSTDDTVAICKRYEQVTLFESPFRGLDEARDKQWLLNQVYQAIPPDDRHFTLGNPECPYWLLSLDGDEELVPGAVDHLGESVLSDEAHSYSVQVLYAWNSMDTIRVDGVYRDFRRPSIFRLMNQAFSYQTTPWGGNLHCSSIPQELIGHSRRSRAAVVHYGYIDADLRAKKYAWYSQVDPDNAMEDFYRHLTQGDTGGCPATATLKWAGPLELATIEDFVYC